MPTATDELIRRLYEAPPDGFVAARAAAIADGRRRPATGTPAKRLAALRKPTVAAWLVNLLALRRPELIDELVELAAALRAAQRGLQGDQLRELSDAAPAGGVRAGRRGPPAGRRRGPPDGRAKLPLGEVEATLTAALAEPEIAEQVRTGRLIRAATYAGFGEVPRPAAAAGHRRRRRPTTATTRTRTRPSRPARTSRRTATGPADRAGAGRRRTAPAGARRAPARAASGS